MTCGLAARKTDSTDSGLRRRLVDGLSPLSRRRPGAPAPERADREDDPDHDGERPARRAEETAEGRPEPDGAPSSWWRARGELSEPGADERAEQHADEQAEDRDEHEERAGRLRAPHPGSRPPDRARAAALLETEGRDELEHLAESGDAIPAIHIAGGNVVRSPGGRYRPSHSSTTSATQEDPAPGS